LSQAMSRIRVALIEFAPEGVDFVSLGEADLHILDFIGQHPTIEDKNLFPNSLFRDIPSTPQRSDYVIIFHCEPPPNIWDKEVLKLTEELFLRARCVITHLRPDWLDVYQDFDWGNINWFQTPWGYDPRVFYYNGESKEILCLMTGYVARSEALDLIYTAARICGGKVVHVGGDIGLDGSPGYTRYERISDSQMRELYAQSLYVNAIRLENGFELPGIEGAASNSQPIYTDLPSYRYWFSDIGLFVPPDDIHEGLVKIFKTKLRKALVEKVRRFEWRNIAPRIWEEMLETVTRTRC